MAFAICQNPNCINSERKELCLQELMEIGEHVRTCICPVCNDEMTVMDERSQPTALQVLRRSAIRYKAERYIE